jgi:hypothetical protein
LFNTKEREMGTRSLVGVMVGDKCRAVYVHWDGYLEGVGRELQAYKTQAEVEALIAPGDRSTLDGGYYADRGETGVGPRTYKTFLQFIDAADGCGAEYYYIFKDGVWYCGDCYGRWSDPTSLSGKLVAYAEALEIEAKYREVDVDSVY